LTNEVEKRAWDFFHEIEEQGGWVKTIETGWLRNHTEEEVWKYENEIRRGERKVVGVNCFQSEEKPGNISYFRPDPELIKKQEEKARRLKKERDNIKVKEALDELREADENGENVMPAMMKAVRAYATLEEITDITIRRYPCSAASSPYYGLKGIKQGGG
jgi:Methylmalonyl-CoA mutase, N-terminal domain/subunit